MIGLDDYRVLWTDPDGDRLCVDAEGWTMSDGSRSVEAVYLPTDHDDKVTVAAAFVDALGLEPCEGGFRAKPRPFRVGDVVRVPRRVALRLDGAVDPLRPFGDDDLEVRGVDGAELWVRHPAGRNSTVNADACRLITPAEEVEQGEVEQSEGEWRTPEEHELADAKRAGVLQIDDGTDDWPESCRSPEDFELHGFDGYLRSAYRVPAGWSA